MFDLFVPEVCGYDPIRDISPVSPDDGVDLHLAFENGFIPDNVTIGDSDYDNNENPRSIFGRPVNDFEAIHMNETLKSMAASMSASGSGETDAS